MKARQLIRKIIREHLENISDDNFSTLIEEIIKRVPFLKEYNKFDNESHVVFQKQKYFADKTMVWNNEIVVLKSLNIFSELTISYRHFNERKWFNFTFKNEILPMLPDDYETELFRNILMRIFFSNNEKFKLSEEISIKDGDKFSEKDFNDLVNRLNKKVFDFEEILGSGFKVKF